MVSFKSIIIPYITVFFNCVLVFAVDSTLIVQGGKSDAANNPQAKYRGYFIERMMEEVLRIGDSSFNNYLFAHYFYIDWMKKDNKDAIQINKDEELGLINRFREIQNGLKTTEKDELVENIKKLTDILIESNRLADEFYKKVMDTLKGDEAKDYEYAHKNHKSLVLMHILDGFDKMIQVYNSVLPEKVPESKMKEFEEEKVKFRNYMFLFDKKEGDYNAKYTEMLDEVDYATEIFRNINESVNDEKIEGGEKIEGNFISSIRALATTVTKRSNAILPGLLAIAISSLIFIMS